MQDKPNPKSVGVSLYTTVIYCVKVIVPQPMPQRDHHDIVKDILEIVYTTQPLFRTRRSQTSIGHDANLTHPQTLKYLKGLVDIGLLILTEIRPYRYYELTKKGRRCLQLFSELEDDLRPVVHE